MVYWLENAPMVGGWITALVGSILPAIASIAGSAMSTSAQEKQAEIARKEAARQRAVEAALLQKQQNDALVKQAVTPQRGPSMPFDPGPTAVTPIATDPFGSVARQLVDAGPKQNPFMQA